MLDHLFLDTVGALRAALDQSLLERAGQDDRLVYDLFTGDLVWETLGEPAWRRRPSPGQAPTSASTGRPGASRPGAASAWASRSTTHPRSASRSSSGSSAWPRRPALSTRTGRAARGEPGDRRRTIWPVRPRSSRRAYEDEGAEPEMAVEVAYEGSYRLPAPSPEESEAKEASLFPGWSGPRLELRRRPPVEDGRHPPGDRRRPRQPCAPWGRGSHRHWYSWPTSTSSTSHRWSPKTLGAMVGVAPGGTIGWPP